MTRPSYTQAVKNQIRIEIWTKAIKALTDGRQQSRVLRKQLVERLWHYCFQEVLLRYRLVDKCDDSVLANWFAYADEIYGNRTPQNLKIAYFSGPEPQNDLNVLVSLGVRLENVWAFEIDKNLYAGALETAHAQFPQLKIYPGPFEDFIHTHANPFDIIYLDFTAPLYSRPQKPFATIQTIFEKQALAELGVVVSTTTEPDCEKEGIDFLSGFFLAQEFIEGSAIGALDKEGQPITWFCEGPTVHGLFDKALAEVIRKNWSSACSAFCSQFPVQYANLVQPTFRILTNATARKRVLARDDLVFEELKRFEDPSEPTAAKIAGDLIMSPTSYPLRHFLESLRHSQSKLGSYWFGQFTKEERGVSRLKAISLGDLLRSAVEGYWPALSEPLLKAMPLIHHALPDSELGSGIFANLPFATLWAEVAVNQLGFPNHLNTESSWRASYRAKERKMLVDSFVFDRCRAFYDWLPMIESYGKDLLIPERQMLSRIFMNCISRQQAYIVPQVYSYTNLAEYGMLDGIANPVELSPRVQIGEN